MDAPGADLGDVLITRGGERTVEISTAGSFVHRNIANVDAHGVWGTLAARPRRGGRTCRAAPPRLVFCTRRVRVQHLRAVASGYRCTRRVGLVEQRQGFTLHTGNTRQHCNEICYFYETFPKLISRNLRRLGANLKTVLQEVFVV
jgi:hypothetical protein